MSLRGIQTATLAASLLILLSAKGNTVTASTTDHKYREWCDPVLGCLNITGDWYSLQRPVNVLPDTRHKINTRFYLHTRKEPNLDKNYEVFANDLTSLAKSPFDPAKRIKFIVHGFIDSGNTEWLKEMVKGLLHHGDCNVFRVDWGDGSRSMYYQAAANSRVVGLEIGYFVNTLSRSFYKLDPAFVHCIGHSLGGHVCGYAGEQINKLGRITGLDPAGPSFTGTDYFIHLDPTDATFVDNIHTDAASIFLLGFGTAQPMGHIDFYPNSGHDQPGCGPVGISVDMITEDMFKSSKNLIACSHKMAIQYFQHTLLECPFTWLAHECSNSSSFENGECYSCYKDNERCSYMGIRADEYVAKYRQFVTMFLDTDKQEPYCVNHYQISVLTDYPKGAERWVIGRIIVTLYGDSKTDRFQITSNHDRITHGELKNTLTLRRKDVGHIQRVELKWIYDDNIFNPGTYCWAFLCNRSLYVQSVEVSAINHYPEMERLDYTSLTCGTDGTTTQIEDGHTQEFKIRPDCRPVIRN